MNWDDLDKLLPRGVPLRDLGNCQLVADLRKFLWLFGNSIAKGRQGRFFDPAVTNDAVNDSIEAFLDQYHLTEFHTSIKAWFAVIVFKKLSSAAKKLDLRGKREKSGLDIERADACHADPCVSEEDAIALDAALHELDNPLYREVARLMYRRGLPDKQIAALM